MPGMTRVLAVVVGLCALSAADTRAEEPFQPAPADRVPHYFAQPMPCKITRDPRLEVRCQGGLLAHESLRELSILRNTIYARYGWDRFRKPWLRSYFHAQPWFEPNPSFSYRQLSDVDRKNAHFIAVREQSLTDFELMRRRNDLFARYGKVWTEKPQWTLPNGKTVAACTRPKGAEAEDDTHFDTTFPGCLYPKMKWYKPDPHFTASKLSDDDKIELGLLARAMGEFALDEDARARSEGSLDRVLTLDELRQLSLRDLRLLRNTIYARRGRTFNSEVLRDHFAGMAWYKPRADYSDKLLTRNDVRNVALIRSVEDEFGGPLSDEDWLKEPATDGA